MTNNGVTVNIACLRYCYTIDLLQRYKLAFLQVSYTNANMHTHAYTEKKM